MECKPVRIQRSRQAKQVSPNGLEIKYCGRGSRWGNPFRVVKVGGKWSVKTSDPFCVPILIGNCRFEYISKREAANDAIRCWLKWLFPYTHDNGTIKNYYLYSLNPEETKELRGKNLSCWCKLDELCHVDILLRIANQ